MPKKEDSLRYSLTTTPFERRSWPVDSSVTVEVDSTLVALDVILSVAKRRLPALDRLLEDEPVVLLLDGKLQQERLRKDRVNVDDVIEVARKHQGLRTLDQIHAAVLERRGNISIIPREEEA